MSLRVTRLASGRPLNSPWGTAMATADFVKYPGDLMISNFGDGNQCPRRAGLQSNHQQTAPPDPPVKSVSLLFGAIAPVPGANEFTVSGTGSHSMD